MVSLIRRSLKARLVAYGVSLFIFIGGAIILASALLSYQAMKKQALTSATESAKNYSVITGNFVNNALQTSLMVRGMVQNGHDAGLLTRQTIGRLIPGIVQANQSILGITVGFEPNRFDGADSSYAGGLDYSEKSGRFAPYFYRDSDNKVVFDDSGDTIPGDPEDEEWYARPLRDNATLITPPYLYSVNGVATLMVTASSILHTKGTDTPMGVIATDIALKQLQTELSQYKPLNVGTTILLSHTNSWVVHPDTKKVGQPETDSTLLTLAKDASASGVAIATLPDAKGNDMLIIAVPVRFLEAKQVWTIFVEIPAAYIAQTVLATVKMQGMLGIALIALGALVFFIIGGQFVNPIAAITGQMTRVSKNELDTEISYTDRPDEIGAMARSLETFRSSMRESADLRTAQEKQKAQAEEQRRAMMRQVADDFERDVKSIVNVVASAATELSLTAQHMADSAKQGAQLATDAAGAAAETTGNVQSVASAAEELSASVREISSQLQRTTSMVQESSEKAQNADVLAAAMNQASNKVREVMEIISGIAGQINLLALNATIESARAGEAGKGFAVVASEVKNLAMQTDRSITGIREVIGEISTASSNIAEAMSGIKKSVGDISGATANVASAVEEQSATTNEIARNMQSAASGTQLISSNLGDVSENSSKANADAGQMLDACRELSRQGEMLNTQVDSFLQRIRSGQ